MTPHSTVGSSYDRIYSVVARIPRGRVATYGQVAKLAGVPNGARQVGYALAALRSGHRLPWHRVVNSQGKISFPPDSAGFQEQKSRLEDEGVVFLNGKINLEKFGYQGALDHLLWGEPM